MIIAKQITQLQKHLSRVKNTKQNIGFVPTMGALHSGHLALIAASVSRNNFTVCSIFVNPTQFNDKSDLQKYPVTIEKDILLLEKMSCGLLFLPSISEIYPDGEETVEKYDLGEIEHLLEGFHRPNHFQGVSQVVERLLRIVQPDELYMGQKDLQQTMIVKKMMTLKRINLPLITVATKREPSGLAMSSRNERLSADARSKAAVIYQMLLYARNNIHDADLETINAYAQRKILESGFSKIDYFSFHDAHNLQPVQEWDGRQKIVVLFAGFIDGVRLIDNLRLN